MKLGISPIGWSNDDIPELGAHISFEQCIEEMANAGYQGCEVGHKFPRDPKKVLEILDSYNLQVCNQWFDFNLSSESLDANLERLKPHLEYLQALGSPVVGGGEKGNSCIADPDLPIFEYQSTFEADDFKRYGELLTKCGELAATYSITLAFHPHLGTVIQSIEDTKFLLEFTDADYVGLNYDSAHYYVGGENPLEALERIIKRVVHVHLKNVREPILQELRSNRMSFLQGILSGIFTVPGDPGGEIDFAPIIQLLSDYNYEGWLVVEADQDPSKSHPKEIASIGYEYVADLVQLIVS